MATEQYFNINFVQEVENYPCLYNYMLPEYVRKDVTEKAWIEIGKKFNLTGAECKEKWRNIRNVFVRNMKPGKSGAGAKKKKPYYLNEVMQFTLPFIKLSTASVSGNLEKPPIDEINQPDIDDLTDEEDGSQSLLNNYLNNTHTFNTQISTEHRPIPTLSPQSPYSVPTPTPQSRPLPTPSPHSSTVSMPTLSPQSRPLPTPSPHSSTVSMPTLSPQSRPLPTPSPHSSTVSLPTPSPTSNLSRKKKINKTKNSMDESIVDYFKAKQARAETTEHHAPNPKRMFLLSLLPDLEPMSDGQMRKFKRGVMQLIDDILEDMPTTSSSMDNSQITLYYETVGQDLTTPLNENT